MFIFGMIFGSLFLEPLIINFIYFTNVDLFIDIILTRKNEDKLINTVLKRIEEKEVND